MIKRRIWEAVVVWEAVVLTLRAFSHHGAGGMPMQGKPEPAQFFVFEELRLPEAPDSCFDAFSSRKPVSTPHQVRGRLLLENALAKKSGRRGWGTSPPFSLPTEGGVFHRKVL
jgi:hypothetical protein